MLTSVPVCYWLTRLKTTKTALYFYVMLHYSCIESLVHELILTGSKKLIKN